MRALDVTAIGIMRALLAQKPVQLMKTVPKFAATARSAAVLVPLCNDNGVPSVLFTARSQAVSTHKGQVSFPGGHVEAGEDAAAAALREAIEECGSGIGSVQVLGLCQTVPA
eukprot:16813-Heterococcus_DN1.PRE.1